MLIQERKLLVCIFLKILFIFRERGKEGEREGEKHQLVASQMHPGTEPATQACALTGNQHGDLLVCETTLQSTEPHQSGLACIIFETKTSTWSHCSFQVPISLKVIKNCWFECQSFPSDSKILLAGITGGLNNFVWFSVN